MGGLALVGAAAFLAIYLFANQTAPAPGPVPTATKTLPGSVVVSPGPTVTQPGRTNTVTREKTTNSERVVVVSPEPRPTATVTCDPTPIFGDCPRRF